MVLGDLWGSDLLRGRARSGKEIRLGWQHHVHVCLGEMNRDNDATMCGREGHGALHLWLGEGVEAVNARGLVRLLAFAVCRGSSAGHASPSFARGPSPPRRPRRPDACRFPPTISTP